MEALLVEIQASFLKLLGTLIQYLPSILMATIVVILTRHVAQFAGKVVQKTAKHTVRNNSLQVFALQVTHISVWGMGLLLASVFLFPDLRLGDLVGLLGLGSVAFGFAFQDIFKNFLAGIFLLLQEPFRIGDRIAVADYEGAVVEVALRSTQIQTYAGEIVVMPNSILLTNPVRVLTALPNRRIDLAIGVDTSLPFESTKEILLNAIAEVEGILTDPEPEIDVTSFSSGFVDLTIRYWTFPEIAQVRRTQTEAILALKQACDRAQLTIESPIRTISQSERPGADRFVASNNTVEIG
ncbi:mechanosensitive ion channel family protein [Geitlerinema sp. PCC 9228]|jgi:small-conductance mechanosensitive channel|uniref:mechanosensitive ion channel family protein n=1 Tax=Geitlerinema sp. PCC 9228 TaxID=111611 RepID=UPI0008F9962F|nr:mechanosensitive ion channel family protein [Geitlerinema sp. PCC 9228]